MCFGLASDGNNSFDLLQDFYSGPFYSKGFFNFNSAKYKTKKHNHYGLAIYNLK